jgi:glutamate N-acetyltransferase/amino-acid N-acetyltransferase
MKLRARLPVQSLDRFQLPKGFSFSAVAAGIKASGRDDLALAEAVPGTTAAALFTRNRVVAAPVEIGRASLAKTRGHVRAVIVNSGNANCATGQAGLRACQLICREAARLLEVHPEEVFPSSTGIIGLPLPAEQIVAKLPDLVAEGKPQPQGVNRFARAIMTTDTRPKLASLCIRSGTNEAYLLGIAKGSGMIHPQLATMLVYLFTDMAAKPADLRRILKLACNQSFNCISVDGDTSTNDTVLLLASGQSRITLETPTTRAKFTDALLAVCQSLAEQIVTDGEGVQHVVRLSVEQAQNRDEALRVARAIAHSLLVKTAWAGADPNWGRVLAAIGACGVPVDPARINILIGTQLVCRRGLGCSIDARQAHDEMSQPAYEIRVQLCRGRGAASYLTTDLTADYVRINAEYST